MNKKLLIKNILFGLLAFALRFASGFIIDGLPDVVICPIMGIFAGIPGIIGCAVGTLTYELISGTGLTASVMYIIPTIVAALLPFIGRRFLKDKSQFSNTWIYFAITAITSLAVCVCWVFICLLPGIASPYLRMCHVLIIIFFCVSFSIDYPVYFLVTAMKGHSIKTGNSLLNAYTFWLPLQFICCIFFAIKVYDINYSHNITSLFALFEDWKLVCLYLLVVDITFMICATLTLKFKRVMLFIFAGILSATSIFNIVRFDTGEGTYILIFAALWVLLHAIFYDWYEQTALKKKAVKVTATVLHFIFIITLVLVTALDISAYIIPKANGEENNVIVLGAPVYNNKASDILEDRISVASDFLIANEEANAIVTGGSKVEGGKTEAEIIRDGLTSKGISEDRIILESGAKTTQENFEKSLQIIRGFGGTADDEIVIITSSFHLLRSGIYARHAGFNNLRYVGSVSFLFKEWSWYIREAFSIIPVLFS